MDYEVRHKGTFQVVDVYNWFSGNCPMDTPLTFFDKTIPDQFYILGSNDLVILDDFYFGH